MIGPLTEGEYFNEVVYEGTYYSPGYCTWADGIDFTFDFNGLTEVDGMEYVLVIDEPDPDSTFMMNGWLPVYAGDSTVFTPSTTGLGISAASGPAELHFHIRLIGTPTTAGQAHPCWIDQMQTLADCNNSWGLLNGETPIACIVQTAIGIEEQNETVSLRLTDNQLLIESEESGQLSFLTVKGRLISRLNFTRGSTRIETPKNQGLVIVEIQSETTRFSKKILLQK